MLFQSSETRLEQQRLLCEGPDVAPNMSFKGFFFFFQLGPLMSSTKTVKCFVFLFLKSKTSM